MSVTVVIFWIACGIVSAVIASSRGGHWAAGLAFGFLLGPLGLILAWFTGDSDQMARKELVAGRKRQCPRCAELVQSAAVVCRYCGHEFSAAENESAAESVAANHKNDAGGTIVFLLIFVGIAVLALIALEGMPR